MMLRRQQSSKYQSNRHMKSIMNKLLLLHSNYLLSEFTTLQSKTTPNPCLRPATSSIIRNKSHKKSAIGLGESGHMQAFKVAEIKDEFMTVSKKKIFEKQNKNSVNVSNRKHIDNDNYSEAQLLQALKSCKVSKVFSKNFPSRNQKRQVLKVATQQNESKCSPYVPKPYKLISQKKSTDTSMNATKQIERGRPWTSFKNSQLKRIIKMKQNGNEIGNNFIYNSNKSRHLLHESVDTSEFNPWVVETLETSQF